MFFDLASLAKPLVTAPLALAHLDLDRDRRGELGFAGWPAPLTVRALLSHSAGLPPWLPYTGEPLALQLARPRPEEAHPLLRSGRAGESTYSDLGYRLLAQLLEAATGTPFPELGALTSGLSPAPWTEAPVAVPDGADAQAWALAAPDRPYPARAPGLPHDANARAGMTGHAGFGCTRDQLEKALASWRAFVPAMAVDTARGADGSRWGLGLQRALTGPGRYGELLSTLPPSLQGLYVLEDGGAAEPQPVPPQTGAPGPPSPFWYHLGYTGPALFVREGLVIALLAHRLGPGGRLLDADALRARRWSMLASFGGNLEA